jgi:hypothetical protein
MNLSTCHGCGDTHLCAGRRPQTGPTLLEHVHLYVRDTYTLDAGGVVGTAAAWNAYLHWCAAHGHVPFSQRRFVQAMAEQPGIRRVKRSTMRFVGITWTQVPRGRHAAPEDESVPARAR